MSVLGLIYVLLLTRKKGLECQIPDKNREYGDLNEMFERKWKNVRDDWTRDI